MNLRELEALLGRSLDPVRAIVGSEVEEVTPISTVRAVNSARSAFRLALADGRKFKLRRLRLAAHGAMVAGLLEELSDEHFPRLLLHDEGILLEEWIEGAPLIPAESHVREAGELLGRMHSRRAPVLLPTAREMQRILVHLEDLVHAGALPAPAAARLRELASEQDPAEAATGVRHGDFCAENMILDTRGRLRVIDNEGLSLGPLDGDLARTFYRWPMSDAEREIFLRAYAAHRDPQSALENALFWRIRVVVKSAHIRVVRGARNASVPLAEIQRLLEARRDSGASRARASDRS